MCRLQELLPNTSNFTPGGSSQQATQRLLSELKQIMKTDPEKQVHSLVKSPFDMAAPGVTRLYHQW